MNEPICGECNSTLTDVRLMRKPGEDGGYANYTGVCPEHGKVLVTWDTRHLVDEEAGLW